jgi:DNA-binding NtrC family response regulator
VAHVLTNTIEASTTKNLVTPCILDQDLEQRDALGALIEDLGYESVRTSDPEQALKCIREGRSRILLAEVCETGIYGYDFLDRVLRTDPGVHVIVTARHYTLESALEAIRRGASHFLPKPVDRARLKRALDDISALYDQRRRVRALEEQLLKDLEFHGIVGKSPATLEVFDFARKVARHYTNVLVVGQTGTGKELVARAIHQLSPVSSQRLAVCNCSALVDTLLESQLFGHLRGSFTGATDSRPGLFEYANGGTVFLDEIGETSLPMQAKLLRVIQNREIQRVGSPEVKQINVRVIAATNRDLRAEVLAGRFREDLFYRLSSIQIRIPPLSERLEDVPLLVQFFLKKYNEAYGKKFPAWHGGPKPFYCSTHGRATSASSKTSSPAPALRPPATSSTSPTFPSTCNNATRLARTLATKRAPLAGRGPQDPHSAGVGDVPGKSSARGAHPRHRSHQSLSLSQARRLRRAGEEPRRSRDRVKLCSALERIPAPVQKWRRIEQPRDENKAVALSKLWHPSCIQEVH